MSDELDAAKRYRDHAEALRTLAASVDKPKTAKHLLDIAADYMHMADQLEQIHKTNKAIEPP